MLMAKSDIRGLFNLIFIIIGFLAILISLSLSLSLRNRLIDPEQAFIR